MKKESKSNFNDTYKLNLFWQKLNQEQQQQLCNQATTPYLKKVFTYLSTVPLFSKDALKASIAPQLSDAHLRNLMAQATELIEELLILESLKAKPKLRNVLLLEVLQEQKMTDWFLKTYKLIQKQSHSYHENYLNYWAEELYFKFIALNQRDQESNIPKALDHLDQFYVQEKMRWILQAKSYQTITNKMYPIRGRAFLEDLKSCFMEDSGIQVYHQVLQLLDSNHLEDYFQLKVIFNQHRLKMNPQDVRFILLTLINFCSKRINTGEALFEQEAFDLYELGIQESYLIDQGQISPFTYKNVLILALKLKKYDWAGHYIDALKLYLEEKYQESYSNYCKAKLYFETQDYKNAMKHLYNVEYEDQIFSLNAKTMLLKIYYERGDFDALESLLGSFKTYIKRKDISPFYKTNFTYLIQLTIKLMNTSSEKQLLKLQHLIESTQPLTEKEWLLQKVKERY